MVNEIGKAPVRGRSSRRIAFAAAPLPLVLLHISSYGTCEAFCHGGRQMTVPGEDEGRSLAQYRISCQVMWKPIHLYIVWFGTWTKEEKNLIRNAKNLLTPKKRLRQYLNLSKLWKIVTEYHQEPQSPGEGRKHVSNKVIIAGEVDDNYSFGHSIEGEENDALDIISSHQGKGLPYDLEQGQYFLFTSGDADPNFKTFCAFHDNKCINGTRGSPYCDNGSNIIYSYVPYKSVSNRLISPCSTFNMGRAPRPGGIPGSPPNSTISPDGALDTLIDASIQSLVGSAVDPRPPGNTNSNYIVPPAWIQSTFSEGIEPATICQSTYAEGDWFYCFVSSTFPAFPAKEDCASLSHNQHALTELKSLMPFITYGIHSSKFLVQMVWSLKNKGRASQPEASCSRKIVNLHKHKGTIQRGLFFNGVGVQHYASGQSCSCKILVRGAKCITLYFETVALGYDDLDFVTVTHDNAIRKKVTGFGKNIKVKVTGN